MSSLNQKQTEAVATIDGPLLILAGAGSGKTRVLIHRIAHILETKKIPPWQILAVTFTNKAAGEMKERVGRLLGAEMAHSMWVSTFHSTCLRVLRQSAVHLGYSTNFSIYDDKDQLQVINRCLDELAINTGMIQPKSVAYNINQAKHQGITAAEFMTSAEDFYRQKMGEIYQLYQKKLLENQAMDFGDLILNVLVLFKRSPEVLQKYRQQFRYIHVDEYQDTNRCQYELILLLAGEHRNLCVVGDDDQSIYRFRGAEIKNILDFQIDFSDAQIIRLEQNYRSTKNIIDAAASVIGQNKKRMGKTLWTANPAGEKITLFQAPSEREEAQFVVGDIVARRADTSFNDIAIFYRTNAQSRSFEDELRKQGLPYHLVGGMKFYERMEIKDILAYLRLMVNPNDGVSLRRIINVPQRGIGKTSLERLEAMASTFNKSLWQAIQEVVLGPMAPTGLSAGLISKLKIFVGVFETLLQAKQNSALADLIPQVYTLTGYWKWLEDAKTIEAESRMENLEEFVTVVMEYATNTENPTLESFLDTAMLASDLDTLDLSHGRVTLMTLHLAKGLEFPIIYMVGLEEGLFPHSRSLESEEDIEEERRLCYVGMTRAKIKLHLSYAYSRHLFGTPQYNLPSRFLDEIAPELLDVIVYKTPTATPAQKTENNFSSGLNIDYSYSQLTETPYHRGVKVRHPLFGIGTVRACEGSSDNQKLTIAFANGQIKKILPKYTQLMVVS